MESLERVRSWWASFPSAVAVEPFPGERALAGLPDLRFLDQGAGEGEPFHAWAAWVDRVPMPARG
jgi:hypothetical protein